MEILFHNLLTFITVILWVRGLRGKFWSFLLGINVGCWGSMGGRGRGWLGFVGGLAMGYSPKGLLIVFHSLSNLFNISKRIKNLWISLWRNGSNFGYCDSFDIWTSISFFEIKIIQHQMDFLCEFKFKLHNSFRNNNCSLGLEKCL